MACIPAENVVLTPNYPARKLIVTWDYLGDAQRLFRVLLFKQQPPHGTFALVAERPASYDARSITFTQQHIGDGQVWVAKVITLCEDCTQADEALSNEVTILFPTPD